MALSIHRSPRFAKIWKINRKHRFERPNLLLRHEGLNQKRKIDISQGSQRESPDLQGLELSTSI